jgi:hypothetical protein
LLTIVLYVAYDLTGDFFDKGCMAWHRDALGYYLQLIFFLVCLLVFLFRV